ncbi:xanthomonadin biosynthesis protein [Dyella sp. 20L07]|uniref:xanthomonadin biosynthesis protein n=1 Tax=Dyella sp. 20L07 TaxID=3384240 RepID=UPI003D29CE03
MSSQVATLPRTTPRRWLPLLLAYPVLAVTGALTHRQGFSLAACVLLVTLLMAPALAARKPLPWLAWSFMLTVMGWLWWRGMAGLLLECVPVAINLLLASLFGRSLRAGATPLIARFIATVEGPERLRVPGVAKYARQLTWFWTGLLAAQACVLVVLLLCATPGGLLATFGMTSLWQVPAGPALLYVHVGGYVLIAAAFLLENGFRRWHLRHITHPRWHELALGIAARWPQLLRGEGPTAP